MFFLSLYTCIYIVNVPDKLYEFMSLNYLLSYLLLSLFFIYLKDFIFKIYKLIQ